MKLLFTAVTAFLLLAAPSVLWAEGQPENPDAQKSYLYEWTDNAGTVHIADGLGKVPEQYRANARKMQSVKGQEPGPAQQSGTGDKQGAQDEIGLRADWQARMREWKSRLVSAESRKQALESERMRLAQQYGALAQAPPGSRERALEIDQELKTVQAEIDEAKDMIDRGLPDEARKAGVPPGWLRE